MVSPATEAGIFVQLEIGSPKEVKRGIWGIDAGNVISRALALAAKAKAKIKFLKHIVAGNSVCNGFTKFKQHKNGSR